MKTLINYINEQRVDELSSYLLKRAAIAAKERNDGKADNRTRRFEKAAIDVFKREMTQAEIDTTNLPTPKNNQKYELYQKEGDLWRIRAIKQFVVKHKNVNVVIESGTLGGLVKSEKNLSQDGNCWIFNEARVIDNAIVCDNALVFGESIVERFAEIRNNAQVYGKAIISGSAIIYESAQVCGNARVYGESAVYGKSIVDGNAMVHNEDINDDMHVS